MTTDNNTHHHFERPVPTPAQGAPQLLEGVSFQPENVNIIGGTSCMRVEKHVCASYDEDADRLLDPTLYFRSFAGRRSSVPHHAVSLTVAISLLYTTLLFAGLAKSNPLSPPTFGPLSPTTEVST